MIVNDFMNMFSFVKALIQQYGGPGLYSKKRYIIIYHGACPFPYNHHFN